MEEKKKTNQTSKKKTTTTKKTSAAKTTATKKVTKKAPAKKTPTKKAAVKKPVAKKAPAKKTAPKKIEKKVEKKVEAPKIQVTEEEARLEKTIIFDGKQSKNLREVVEKLEEENVVVDDKVIKRSKINRIAVVVLAIAMILVAAASTGYVLSQKAAEKKNSQTVNSNIYEKIKNNNEKSTPKEETKKVEGNDYYENIETITLSQFENKILAKEKMVVMIASSTCYSCITYEPTVDKVFGELEKKIYRIDIVDLSQDEISRLRTYYSFTSTPTIFVVKDGVVTADLVKSQTEKDLKDWVDKNY